MKYLDHTDLQGFCIMEVWKKILNYEDYQISNFGRIKSLKNNKQKILTRRKIKS